MAQTTSEDDGHVIIFVASIKLPNGKRIYAYQYGKKAFPIRVKRNGPS